MSTLGWLKSKEEGRKTLFYFMPSEYVLSTLENERVKISEFSKCNDIFELSSFVLTSAEIRSTHRNWIENVEKNLGIICLSESWKNPLMWAHYANRGEGVCLVISVNKSQITKVTYSPKRRERDCGQAFPESPAQEGFYEFCAAKFSSWKYEKEYRFFCFYDQNNIQQEDGYRFFEFNPGFELLGVITGPKPKLGKAKIFKSAKTKLNFFQCRPAFSNFDMVLQRNESLWKA